MSGDEASDPDSDVVSDEDSETEADSDTNTDADSSNSETDPESSGGSDGSSDDSSSFLGNLKNARGQLGDAKDAFSNARDAGNLPTDEAGRVRIVCRRYAERRLVPLDDGGRPSCYEAGNEDCESCVDAVNDGDVGTW